MASTTPQIGQKITSECKAATTTSELVDVVPPIQRGKKATNQQTPSPTPMHNPFEVLSKSLQPDSTLDHTHANTKTENNYLHT